MASAADNFINDRAVVSAGLAGCEALLASHLSSVTRLYGNHGLGLVDLPPLDSPDQIVPAQVESGAVLYWCAKVEAAGVLPFVEALAQQLYEGRLTLPIQRSARLLRPFWRSAEHRFTAPERAALYRSVLDAGMPGMFERQLQNVALALAAIGREAVTQNVLHLQTRASVQIYDLAHGLSTRSVGISGFAARDIVSQVRAAMEMLNDEEINHALGGGSIAFMLQRWAPQFLSRIPATTANLSLAQHGVDILRWIAREAGGIRQNPGLITRSHPVVGQAEAWLASSLDEHASYR